MEKIKVIIEGTTPILFNRFRDVAIEGKSKKRTGAMAETDIDGDKSYVPACSLVGLSESRAYALKNKLLRTLPCFFKPFAISLYPIPFCTVYSMVGFLAKE